MALLLGLLLLLSVQADSSHQQPAIDWSALGQVAFLGSFSSLSFYQSNPLNSSSISPNHATLVRHPSPLQQQQHQKQSSPHVIATTSSPGSINSICSSPNSHQVFVGGRFDSLNSTPSTANIAIYNTQTHSISSLSNSSSIQGSVHSIDCSNQDQIWIAGQFQNPIGANLIPNLIIWSPKSGFQSPTLPNQFDGPIYSLLRLITPSGDSLLIGGQFTLPISSNVNSTNRPSISPSSFNIDTNKNDKTVPPVTLGSTLSPITLSNDATWSASPPSSLQDYQSPSNIFCPGGPDGPGNSWELDNRFDNGIFTLNLGTSVPVGGIRLGNSFANGGGTAGFHVVALPNNNILNLNFMNPVTNQLDNCLVNCTLSRDLNIPYQDFLFPPNTALTGIQLVVTSKFGSVAGLHLLQLFSQGNTAYAVDQLNNPPNRKPCRTGIGAGPSNSAKATGNWKVVQSNTNFPGTVQSILSASVPPGTTPNDGPTLTWTLPVPQFGRYELILQTPGCSSTNDCSSRTSLSVTTSNSDGAPLTTTVDTRKPDDFSTTLYNGTLTDSASGGSPVTVTIRLASTVSGSSPATMVANQLVLRSTSPLVHFESVTSNSIYELVLAGRGAFGDGSTTSSSPPNDQQSITNVNRLGTRLMIGSAARSVISDSHTVFLAGERLHVANGTSGVTTTTATTVPNGGLNGTVNALLAADGVLYAGGNFTATADGTVQGLGGLAYWRYGSSSQVWEPISQRDSGVGLPIQAFQMIGGLLHIFGRSNDAGRHALGVYSPQNSSWVPSNVGVYFGQLTAATTGAGNSQELYLAGNLDAIGAIEAPSSALLSIDSDGNPMLTGLNFQINQTASQAKASSPSNLASLSPLPPNETNSISPPSNSALQVRTVAPRQLVQSRHLQPRQLQSGQDIITGNPNASMPYALTGTTSATILAGAFFKDHELIVGGRFVSSNAVSNVGIYDLSMSSLKSLNGTKTLEGSVLSIKVVGDVAWIGGTFISPSGKTGLDTYNLTSGRWATEMMADVAPYTGTNVTVKIIKSMTTGEVVIGGRFQQVGSLSCQSICMWSGNSNQWFSLGSGLKGVVNAIEFTGKTHDQILAVGKFEINSTFQDASVAKWILNSSTPAWTPIGSQNRIPGPIRSIAIGELQQGEPNGMFIGGQSSSVGNGAGGSAFLMTWKDNDWINVDGLDPRSQIEHLAFVPLRNPSVSLNTQNGIQSDRLLHVGGWIVLPGSNDKFASVLFDGHTWIPYLTDSDFHGQPGILSRVITTTDQFKSTLRRIHSVVAVIFISMAIALAIVLLGVLIGYLIGRQQRSRENGKKSRKAMYSIDGGAGGIGVVRGLHDDDDENVEAEGGLAALGGDSKRSSRSGIESRQARRPTSLLATIDAATSAMAERMQIRQEQQSQHEEKGHNDEKFLDRNEFSHGDQSPDLPPAVPFDHRHSQIEDFAGDQFDEDGLLTDDDVRVARWSFDPQLPGEIAVAAGESVEVRDRSNQEWWLVRRADGVEGVVPADWFL